MKLIKKLGIVFLVLFIIPLLGQQLSDDPQKVKDALLNYVLYSQELEKYVQELKKRNQELTVNLDRINLDLKKIKPTAQVDSLKKVYGLIEPEKSKGK